MASVVSPLNLAGALGARSQSPVKAQPQQRYKTPKKKERNNFPTTPRSVEKQKKMLGARLKRLMEQNLRLNATNKILKAQNKQLLDQAVHAESESFQQE